MPKKKILIASILKPIDDTRMYEKIGISLANKGKYEVHIAGYVSQKPNLSASIQFHPCFDFYRISVARIFAFIPYFQLLMRIKPDAIIFNTHELLIPSVFYRLLYKCHLVYDVLENHFRNILYTDTFPWVMRLPLALWVRTKEYALRMMINKYFLAEKYYENEFNFSKGKSIIIENKCKIEQNEEIKGFPIKKGTITKLLFSGTLSENTGVYHAINLTKAIYDIDNNTTLEIIGYSHIPSVINEIKKRITGLDYINLVGGNNLVPHIEIIEKIRTCDFGIICYPQNKSTINATPTKLYEYLAYKLPIILHEHPKWEEICEENQAGICIDFDNFDPSKLLNQMKSFEFYQKSDNTPYLWKSEEDKLLAYFDISFK